MLPVNNQMNPDPDFTNTKDPNPENPLSFEEAMKIAKKMMLIVFYQRIQMAIGSLLLLNIEKVLFI